LKLLNYANAIRHDLEQAWKARQRPPKPELPVAIQFPVNDICNSRCQMCNIWQQKRDHEITPDEVRQALSNPLYRKVVSVGMNGGEPTLRKDIGELTAAVCETLPSLSNVFLITNSILHKKVIEAIDAMSEACNSTGVKLHVMCSLDGVGEPGNFEAVLKVAENCKQRNDLGSFTFGCTIVRDNVYGIEELLWFSKGFDVDIKFRVAIPHQRLYSLNVIDPFALNSDELFHLCNFLDYLRLNEPTIPQQARFYHSLRNQLAYGMPREAGCVWQHAGVTLSSRGELSYCAVASKNLGDAIHEDSEKLFFENTDHLEEIYKNNCDNCYHDYTGMMPPSFYLTTMRQRFTSKVPKGMRDFMRSRRKNRALESEKQRIAKLDQDIRTSVKVSTERPNRFLITGWYGTETLGDKAILGGVISAIRAEHPDADIDVASMEPYVSKYTARQMPDLSIQDNLSHDQSRQRLNEGKYGTVVLGGGPLMTIIGECTTLYEMFALGKQSGARCVVAGCGVGPLTHAERNPAILGMLNAADAVVLRDQASVQSARDQLGYTGEATSCIDPAAVWIHEQLQANPAPPRDPNRVLLALREWSYPSYASELSTEQSLAITDQYHQQVRQLIHTLRERQSNTEIVPFCMHKYAVGGDDRMFYRERFGDDEAFMAHLDVRHRTPAEDLQTIATSGRMLTMRFHSLVFALITRTPFFALDYTRGGKIRGLLEDLGMADRMVAIDDFDGVAAAEKLLSTQEVPDISDRVRDAKTKLVAAMAHRS